MYGIVVSNGGFAGVPSEKLGGIAYVSSHTAHENAPYAIMDGLELPGYKLNDRGMRIYDVAWGECHINAEKSPFDSLLLQLARTPLFRRLQSVEQLTLGEDYATMPNTMSFSRWQHIWGSLVFVRKMCQGTDVNQREREVMQLRTLLSDVGHTAFSHLGDWLFQGDNGGEDLHDQDLKNILAVSGVKNLLEQHDFSVEETVFPDVADCVECPSPDLCVDRVDYGIREILRWLVPIIPLHMYRQALTNPQSLFAIDEQRRLVSTNLPFAQSLAAGYSLLPTEHWSHPVHRLQLQLFQMAVRGALVHDDYSSAHPRELMYRVDADFKPSFHTWPLLHLHRTMKEMARAQRQIFVEGRSHDLQSIFIGLGTNKKWKFPEFPDPLTAYSWQSQRFVDPYPANVVIEQTQDTHAPLEATQQGLTVYLPALKPRAIDPLVKQGAETEPLSHWAPSYKPFLEGQRQRMAAGHLATICMRPDIARHIVKEYDEVMSKWQRRLQRPRNPEMLKTVIADSGYTAAGYRFDNIVET